MEKETEKKRVLQISNYYFPELGGIEKIAQAISKAVEGQYEEKIICFTHDKQDKTEYIGSTELIRCGTKAVVDSQQLSFSMKKKMKGLMESYDPDIVIIHLPNPFTTHLTLKYISDRAKLIVYWHSDIVKQVLGERLFRNMVFKLLDRADRIIATSPNYIDDSIYLSKYKNKCTVIPNCIEENNLNIDDETQSVIERIKTENTDKIICVGVGRQVPYKGFEYVIRAIKELDDRFELYLVGRKGESTSEMERLSSGMDNVHLIGEADHKTLKAYLASCDIFCFPSITKNEAFGIALAEGMYFGKPAVTFTIHGSGVNYVSIADETGLEVSNADVKGYADALRKLADDPDMRHRLGDNAGRRVRDLFLSEHFGERFRELLAEL